MKRWLYWQFTLPRVLMVAVVLLAAQYILGIVARTVAFRWCEATIGARVDVGHARVSPVGRQFLFTDLHVVNPQRLNQCVLEADRCELNLAAGSLLHKQAVVDSGRISGIRLGVVTDVPTDKITRPPRWFHDDADRVASTWLDKLDQQFSLDLVKQFESVQRAESFCREWSKQSATLDTRLEQLDARTAELQQAVDAAQTNPLRNDKALNDLPKKVANLQLEFAKFKADVEQLPDLLETERRAIVAARRHDDETASKRLSVELIDAKALNAYLMRQQTELRLRELAGWLRWMHDLPPANATCQLGEKRGEDIWFAGCRRGPEILIRSLELDGAARIGSQPVAFRGLLTNLASDPKSHDRPMRLRLTGTGSLPFELQSTIDRKGDLGRDELVVDCKGILLPAVALGQTDQLQLKLAPCVGSLSVSLLIEGDKLSGDIQMVQQGVQITPTLHGSNSATLSIAMGETLGRVNSVATRVSLGGTLSEPTCSLWSNLGVAVAEAMERGLRRTSGPHARTLLAEADRRVDERLANVDRQIAELQSRFASSSSDMTARLQKIALTETPRYRISAEHGGRWLPNNSLFR